MGSRCEPRKTIAVPVRIFGTDRDGRVFSENVSTIDVSQHGVKLGGVRAHLQVDEIVGLSFGKNKAHFRVRWTGAAGTPAEGTVGLLNLTPEKPLWDFVLPHGIDAFQTQRKTDRRRWPRVKCSVSVEIRRVGHSVIWGRASDISEGGCFVEMPIPLAADTRLEIALWIGDVKLQAQGKVVSVAPGFGNGVCFLDLVPEHLEHLRRFIQSIAPHPHQAIAQVKHSGA
ncbi:MAG TPA: PilZ domain-containing protein [Terriglobales bacterium]|jgi:hypothetical protein|nr:PilZ domain-containing protein [Terriglobales bacterium]